jgi:D-sedoheptulose 7-phosphate isomerase
MNKIQEIFETTENPTQYARSYLTYLAEMAKQINEVELGQFVDVILKARDRGSAVYFIGNGGSAATASHFANDIQIGTRSAGKPFRVQSLTDNVAILTAVGNDYGYEHIYVKQLEALVVENDVVVAISASGNSPNVIRGIEFAKTKKCITVSLTGFDGGQLQKMTDLNVHVPSNKGEYGPVEDFHMIFDHIIGTYLMYHCKRFDN